MPWFTDVSDKHDVVTNCKKKSISLATTGLEDNLTDFGISITVFRGKQAPVGSSRQLAYHLLESLQPSDSSLRRTVGNLGDNCVDVLLSAAG